MKEKLGENQFQFEKSTGTREAIMLLKLTLEERLKKGLSAYVAFVGFT